MIYLILLLQIKLILFYIHYYVQIFIYMLRIFSISIFKQSVMNVVIYFMIFQKINQYKYSYIFILLLLKKIDFIKPEETYPHIDINRV